MISCDTQYRVCYADTDMMGVIYYGNYPRLYEIGRTEMIRKIWKSYRLVEEEGIILPVRQLTSVYHKSAFYDELLTIRTLIKEIPKAKFTFYSQIYNENNELINEGEVVLGFVNKLTGKPCRCPQELIQILEKRFAEGNE